AWTRLFDEKMAGLRFAVDGRDLTLEETTHLLSGPDRPKREAAAHALSGTFAAHARDFALVTNTLVKDKEIEDRWRAYPAPETERHLSNQVEPEVVDALSAAVQAAYPRLSHRFYALKARWLGLDR